VSDKFELRLVGVSYGFAPSDTRGWLDPSLGFKYRLYQGNCEVTFVGQTTVPVGESSLRTNEWNPTAKIAWTKALGTDTWGGNVVVSRVGSGDGRFTQSALSLFVSRPINSRFSLTPEIWVVDRVAKGERSGVFASLAGTYLLNNDTQLDLRLGTGLNQRRDGWFLQGGISIRF
jgi:hypothetical protein